MLMGIPRETRMGIRIMAALTPPNAKIKAAVNGIKKMKIFNSFPTVIDIDLHISSKPFIGNNTHLVEIEYHHRIIQGYYVWSETGSNQ